MFFFFFGEENVKRYAPMGLSDEEKDNVVKRLLNESSSQGLKSVDVSELTGWKNSKISKIKSSKQKLSDDDIKTWARSLGYAHEPFLEKTFDFREYRVGDYIRSVPNCLKCLQNNEPGSMVASGVINYELPLSIIATLGLRASDYCVRTKNGDASKKCPDEIKIWRRGIESDASVWPVITFLMSPDNGEYIFSINVESKPGAHIQNALKEYKGYAGTIITGQADFESYAKENQAWISTEYSKSVVDSFHGRVQSLSDNEFYAQEENQRMLIKLFDEYVEIVWHSMGKDIKPAIALMKQERPSLAVIKKAKALHSYKCEIDPAHDTFLTDEGTPYVEIAHIIPLKAQGEFRNILEVESNYACLCPTCHARMHKGRAEDREDIILKLFRAHKDDLQKAGIDISTSELLKLYNL